MRRVNATSHGAKRQRAFAGVRSGRRMICTTARTSRGSAITRGARIALSVINRTAVLDTSPSRT
jgi:hypothetical protein